MFLGIDFGTTNSAVALAHDDGRAELIGFPSGAGETTTFRSVLYFDPERRGRRGVPEPWTGPQALAAYLEGHGEGRLIQSLKSYLASRVFTATQVMSQTYTLEALVALLLGGLREGVLRRLGTLPEHIVVGRPVRFGGAETEEDDALAIGRLRAAFERAGFPAVEFVHEPVGAAFYYESTLDRDELVLIADFGGGTSDFSLMRVGPGLRGAPAGQRILGTEGVGLAGDAFDARLVDHVVSPALGLGTQYRSYMDRRPMPVPPWLYSRLRRWHHLSFLKSGETMRFLREVLQQADEPARIAALIHVVEADLGYHLYRAVEGTKVGLSTRGRQPLAFVDEPVEIRAEVERTDFEAWVSDELAAIAAAVDRLLAQARLDPSAVDRVFLTGGSSFVPAVRHLFESRFGPARLRGGNEMTSVALGLSLAAREQATSPR